MNVGAFATVWAATGARNTAFRFAAAVRAAAAFTRPNPPWGVQVPLVAPLSGVAVVVSALRIWLRERAGLDCFIRATTAATLGAAEDVPKKLGRVATD